MQVESERDKESAVLWAAAYDDRLIAQQQRTVQARTHLHLLLPLWLSVVSQPPIQSKVVNASLFCVKFS